MSIALSAMKVSRFATLSKPQKLDACSFEHAPLRCYCDKGSMSCLTNFLAAPDISFRSVYALDEVLPVQHGSSLNDPMIQRDGCTDFLFQNSSFDFAREASQ